MPRSRSRSSSRKRRSSRSRSNSPSKSRSRDRRRSRTRQSRERSRSRSQPKAEAVHDDKVKEEIKEEIGKRARKSRFSSTPPVAPHTPSAVPPVESGEVVKTEADSAAPPVEGENPEGKRKRKTRWDTASTSETARAHTGFTVATTAVYDKQKDEQELFLLRMRLQYLQGLLGNNGPFDKELAGESPEPVYDAKGTRTNTREQRAIAKIKKEQADLVAKAITLTSKLKGVPIPAFRQKLETSIDIPVKEYPDYNFKGLIIGPRGVNQRRLEDETGCKIAVRGIGMGRKINGVVTPGEGDDLPLHVQITALDGNQATLDKGIEKVSALLKAPPGPEERAKQLREVAKYNGTWESRICTNCGEEGHLLYHCPKREKPTWSAFNVACVHCGANTHVAVDCPLKLGDPKARSLHKEYDEFMSEIGSAGGGDAKVPGGGAPMGGGSQVGPGGGALRFPHLHPMDIRNAPNWAGSGASAGGPPHGAFRPSDNSGSPMGIKPPFGAFPPPGAFASGPAPNAGDAPWLRPPPGLNNTVSSAVSGSGSMLAPGFPGLNGLLMPPRPPGPFQFPPPFMPFRPPPGQSFPASPAGSSDSANSSPYQALQPPQPYLPFTPYLRQGPPMPYQQYPPNFNQQPQSSSNFSQQAQSVSSFEQQQQAPPNFDDAA